MGHGNARYLSTGHEHMLLFCMCCHGSSLTAFLSLGLRSGRISPRRWRHAGAIRSENRCIYTRRAPVIQLLQGAFLIQRGRAFGMPYGVRLPSGSSG